VNFHYDWHWQWATGNGDMVHRATTSSTSAAALLGDPDHPARVFTAAAVRLRDDGETPNTFLVHYDYPCVYFEVRRPAGEARRDERLTPSWRRSSARRTSFPPAWTGISA